VRVKFAAKIARNELRFGTNKHARIGASGILPRCIMKFLPSSINPNRRGIVGVPRQATPFGSGKRAQRDSLNRNEIDPARRSGNATFLYHGAPRIGVVIMMNCGLLNAARARDIQRLITSHVV